MKYVIPYTTFFWEEIQLSIFSRKGLTVLGVGAALVVTSFAGMESASAVAKKSTSGGYSKSDISVKRGHPSTSGSRATGAWISRYSGELHR